MDFLKYNNLFELKNKTAIVTGAVGILGKEFCTALACYGADVAVVDINGNEALDFSDLLRKKYGIRSIGIQCDVSQPESVNEMVEQTIAELGDIHILHNNAAGKSADLVGFFQPFEQYSLQMWQEIMSVNINGMFLVAQAVGKKMVSQGCGGSIIQTSSIYGTLAPDNRIYENAYYLGCNINTPAVYAVSKAAVVSLTKYLATYWADKKIRVNCISPGGVESGQNQSFIENYSKRVPMNRMANRDEMVGALIYLASDASSYITGQNIMIDGGLSAW